MNPVIALEHIYLNTDWGEPLFTDLSFRLQAGEAALIVGGSGAGKSLLLELIIGARRPASGSVEVLGTRTTQASGTRLRQLRARIGGVGGAWSLVDEWTVSDNVMLPLIIQGERPKAIRERMMKTLGEFQLGAVADLGASRLTTTQRFLTQLARASIAHQPILLVDELLIGLDDSNRAMAQEKLTAAHVAGRSLLLVSSQSPSFNFPGLLRYHFAHGQILPDRERPATGPVPAESPLPA